MRSTSLDPELCALAACALAPAGVDVSPALGAAAGNRTAEGGLLDRASRYQLRPQLAAQAQRLAIDPAGALGAGLAVFATATQGRGRLMAAELRRVLDTLDAASLLAVPFKGPVFAALAGEGPGSREMNDLDVLVRPADVVPAMRALAPIGYTPILPPQAWASSWLTRVTSEAGLVAHQGAILIELHWQMSPGWYPAPCAVDDVMARLTERQWMGGRVRWPAAEELFLAHVADGMKSCGNGLRWIADAARLLRQHPDLDWARVRDVASRRGGLHSVRVALAVTEDLSNDTARRLGVPALSVSLAPAARALAEDARRLPRLANAARSIRQRLEDDDWMTGALPQFLWALRLADHPTRIARAIARHLGEPTVNDLAAMPSPGEPDTRLRWRSLRRRAGWPQGGFSNGSG